MAVAAASDDPSIQAAASIAMAAGAELVIVEARESVALDSHIQKLASETGLTIRHVALGESLLFGSATFSPTFHELHERLVVMTRGVFEDAVTLTIASARRVPVLIVEPPETIRAPRETSPEASLTADVDEPKQA